MRKKIVAANWKMNLNLEEGKILVDGILANLPAISEHKQVVIAPSFVHLTQTASQLDKFDHVYLGAQNCSTEASGAFTGDVAASMLKSAGVAYAIIGHSERRAYFNETDEQLVKKINQALNNDLKVIFCCGEALAERDANNQNAYVGKQIEAALFQLSNEQLKNVVIAYEPIWAIGTGRTASAMQAQEMHAHIRSVVAGHFGQDAANQISILYGGSCNDKNASELFACADVDGGLIGGAALKVETFLPIIQAMTQA